MKTRTSLASLGVFFAGIALCFASGSSMGTGTWKLNEAKSTFSPGMTKNYTVVYAPAGDMVKVTVDGVDKDGKATHNEWTGKFDGKNYPIVGDANFDARSYTIVDDHTLDLALFKGGKVTATAKIVLAADGKSRTVTSTGTDASGKQMKASAVYDKQ